MIEQQDTPTADRVSPRTTANPCSDVGGSVLHSATRHFSPAEVAELWHLSVDTVRRLFEHEPGVVVIEPPAGRYSNRRRYRKTTNATAETTEDRYRRLFAPSFASKRLQFFGEGTQGFFREKRALEQLRRGEMIAAVSAASS